MQLRTTVNSLFDKFEKTFDTHNNIEVSRAHVLHNFDVFTSLSQQRVVPVLKGNAYGHGIEQVAAILKARQFPYIAVDGYFEALRVRAVSRQPVLVMGAIKPENFSRLKYDNFAFVVQDAATIHAVGATKKRLKLHLECNTGMSRYGASPSEIAGLAKLVLSYKNLELEGVMSHLADSDGKDPATVNTAVRQFDACVEAVRAAGGRPRLIHVAQTAGSLKARSKYANMMRLGLGLYGVNPFVGTHPLHTRLSGLKPALRLQSTITKVVELEKGDKVSYNYTFTAPKHMRIGVLPLGYYEGVPRELSNRGLVKTAHGYAPVAGRVCMNHAMIDLGDMPLSTGDAVTVFSNRAGDTNTIDAIAASFGLFNYSLLSSLSSDIRRKIAD